MDFKSYDKMYLEDVMDNIGSLLENSIDKNLNIESVWSTFINSNLAKEIEKGNPKFLSGYSGLEYLKILLESHNIEKTSNEADGLKYYWGRILIGLSTI